MTDLTPTVTAPDFATDRLAYYVWHLREYPQIYKAFRHWCDQYRAPKPDRHVSADMICHVIRYQTGLKAGGDQFDINNNLTPLFARLYTLERPLANFGNRKSWLDILQPDEWQQIIDAFEPIREKQAGLM